MSIAMSESVNTYRSENARFHMAFWADARRREEMRPHQQPSGDGQSIATTCLRVPPPFTLPPPVPSKDTRLLIPPRLQSHLDWFLERLQVMVSRPLGAERVPFVVGPVAAFAGL
jgi:hypothetical protein